MEPIATQGLFQRVSSQLSPKLGVFIKVAAVAVAAGLIYSLFHVPTIVMIPATGLVSLYLAFRSTPAPSKPSAEPVAQQTPLPEQAVPVASPTPTNPIAAPEQEMHVTSPALPNPIKQEAPSDPITCVFVFDSLRDSKFFQPILTRADAPKYEFIDRKELSRRKDAKRIERTHLIFFVHFILGRADTDLAMRKIPKELQDGAHPIIVWGQDISQDAINRICNKHQVSPDQVILAQWEDQVIQDQATVLQKIQKVISV